MSLPESLERAATKLTTLADQIRPANGDPDRLLEELNVQEAGELLIWMLAHEFDAADELVDIWGETEEGAAVLMSVTEERLVTSAPAEAKTAKAARKLLRKAHHRLRSRGIEFDSAPAPKAAPQRVAAVEDPFEEALLSSPDFRGARVGYLADRHPAGGARLFEIRFDEGRGILDFKVYNAGRSKVRGFLRSLSSAQAHSSEQRLFDVPRTALCALVRRASLSQPVDRPLPSGFVEWRGRIFPESLEGEATPGDLARAALAESGARVDPEAAVAAVVELIVEGKAGPWPPPTSWVSERMDRGRKAVEGTSGSALESGIDAWRVEVANELAEETDRALLARNLEELAWVRWHIDVRPDGQAEAEKDGLVCAGDLISTATAALSDEGVNLRLAEARVDSLFAPFLGELRVSGEGSPTDRSQDAD